MLLISLSCALFKIKNLADKMVNSEVHEFHLKKKRPQQSSVYSSVGIKGESYREGIFRPVGNGV